jgi:hypothetical protein
MIGSSRLKMQKGLAEASPLDFFGRPERKQTTVQLSRAAALPTELLGRETFASILTVDFLNLDQVFYAKTEYPNVN